jgi:hypothetical protein
MCSARDDQTLLWPGCPIRRSAGRRLFSASPRLIAAVHVLHRLLVPRHPPCALSILTEKHTTYSSLCRFQGAHGAVLHGLEEPRPKSWKRGLSKLNSVIPKRTIRRFQTRSTYIPGLHIHRVPMRAYDRNLAAWNDVDLRCWSPHIPRKEVIQPHLPVRLPCYDFTPITQPTFDGSPPCGLGHRLRVFQAFVV